ncbi:MAG: ribosome-binding ATPase [Candidatus Binatota bacterium]|nr:ribosome-binding ATPase [Candidatus Binatota bacterium]
MKIVIAGFPRSGKTTVFQSLTGLADSAAARGGAVRGVVRVPDPRVDRLSEIYQPKKTTYATVVFVDVADPGGADKATALSAPLVGEIRDADAIAAVIRDFPDAEPADPVKELRTFEDELVLADLGIVEKRLERLIKEAKKTAEEPLLARVVEWLGDGKPLRSATIAPVETKLLSGYQLASAKPLLVLLNRSEADAAKPIPDAFLAVVHEHGAQAISLSAVLEREIAELPPQDQAAFLRDAGLVDSARDRFVRAAYGMLDLVSFLTSGEDEVRAWTIRRGTPAQAAAGKIHSDIEKGFIRAEVVAYDDFIRCGSEAECKKAGKTRLEGKEYVVADGDIVHFRFNV